ncbi:MAG: hypothetical protein IJ005_03880 [Bacteroidales bacterium]|nr:hypothetical protein [Bacteroidales bacterium]
MKKLSAILSALAVIAASCQKESQELSGTPTLTYVSAYMEDGLTRTALGEKDGNLQTIVWESKDKININGIESAELAEGGKENAVFEFTGDLGSSYHAAYPSSAISNYDSGTATGILPSVQNYREGQFDASAGLMLGTGDKDGVRFKHAMAYIAFIPQGEGSSITSLELTAVGSEKLSGAFTTDYATLTMSSEASGTVTVNCAAPVALGNEIIVSIPAQTYAQGFTVKFTDSAGGSIEKTAGGSFTAAAGHIYTTRLPYVAESGPAYPQTLHMSGGFNGWTAVQLEKIDEGRFRIENQYFNFFNSDEDPKGHGIKFFENAADWSNQWGPKEAWEGTDYRGWELAPYADAPQFYPQLAGFESGNYTVLVDFTTMKLTLTAEEDIFDPAQCLYIMGGPFGWDFTESNALLPVSENIYEGHNFHLTPGTSFKFTTYEWGTEYVKDYSASDDWTMTVRSEQTGDMYFVLGDDAQGGKYTIRLDLNTMKVSLTLTEPDQITYIYLYGAAFADYEDWTDWIPVPSIESNVYETTINLNVGAPEYARGFKIYKAQNDWDNEYCMHPDSTHDDIRFGHKNDTGDNQVIPLNVGYTESGNYVVRIDFNTMKITFTKVN